MFSLAFLSAWDGVPHFGLEHDRPHQADSDALATAYAPLKCLEEIDELPLLTVRRLSDLFADEDSDLAWFFDGIRADRSSRQYKPETPIRTIVNSPWLLTIGTILLLPGMRRRLIPWLM